VIRGSIGADVMTGGPGADTFQFGFLSPSQSKFQTDSPAGEGNRDVITDFRSGVDKFDFTGPTGYFRGVSNLTITDEGDAKIVSYDANFFTGPIHQEIEVHGTIGLGDFIL
jgi:Ca2+-binding RTX toxin-like protein